MGDLFRAWKPSPKNQDPEIQRLEKEAEETRQKIAQLREQGRLRRAHRLQSLDALETRRMTLVEILKRMEKELQEKDVNDYADVLAEAFGERKIFAHRAIGLEALLCQFMHQMLAKQHQLKIMKRAGKELQKFFQSQKNINRDEFHSFEVLAVHVETMRLSLEAQYDDVFAAQHSILARLYHVEAGGTMTNYKIVKPPNDAEKEKKKSPTLTVSNKHGATKENPLTPSHHNGGESDDDDAVMQHILMGPEHNTSILAESLQNIDLNDSKSSVTNFDLANRRRSEGSMKTARDRRREIEQRRLATGRRGLANNMHEDPDKDKARERLRQLEAKRASLKQDTVELRPRNSTSSKNSTTSASPKSHSSSNSISSGGSMDEDDTSRVMRRRERRRAERPESKTAATTTTTPLLSG